MHKPDNFNRALCSAVHTVAPGDTLYQIARQHGTDYQRLMTLNGITNPYNIQPGQRICIPKKINPPQPQRPSPPNTPNTPNMPENPLPADRQFHTVQAGDTLYSISRRYSIPLSQLMQANPRIDPYNLLIGQNLIIPAVTEVPTMPREPQEPVLPEPPAISQDTMNSLKEIDRQLYEAEDTAESDIEEVINPPQPSPTIKTITAYVSDSSADGIIYSIGENDTLTSIQAKFGVCLEALRQENPDVDFAGDISGLTICIPYEDRWRKTCERSFYAVKYGDSINTVAMKTGMPEDKLLILNPGYSPEDFAVTGNLIRLI